MRERNPFLLRTAERISSNEEFIKLFSPKILDLIKENLNGYSLWNQFFRFQSSPGGGKTSLLKLFSPAILHRLQQIVKNRIDSSNDIDTLFRSLKELDVYNKKDELNVLTIYISCASDYDNITRLRISDQRKERLFISLLNARVFIAFVRAFLEYIKIEKPSANLKEELEKIKILPSSIINIPSDFPIECDGLNLYDWSGKVEKSIYREIDGFKDKSEINFTEHTSLFSAQLLTESQIHFESDVYFPKNFAIFFDDVQKLAFEQYNFLTNEIIEKRPANGIWFAERLDLFGLNELWSREASTGGRDYMKQINLEELFRNTSKFKDFSINVAEKRVERAKDISITSFPSSLLEELDLSERDIEIIIKNIKNKIEKAHGGKLIYTPLINHILSQDYSDPFNKACDLRTAQVIIERQVKKNEKRPKLFEDEYLIEEFELEKKGFSKNIASYLISKDYKIPYYFGYNNLVAIASSNIEQFLAFSGRLFEDVLSANVLGIDSRISAVDQENILKKEVEMKWRDLRSLALSKEVSIFLDSVAKFCLSVDSKPGFSYRGVTGFALTLEDRKRLVDKEYWVNNPHYELIAKILTVAIASNLIEVILERKQGQKGLEPKTIFYLNRWLCLKYNLSLHYSGWRKVSLDTLARWIKIGYDEKGFEGDKIENDLYGTK